MTTETTPEHTGGSIVVYGEMLPVPDDGLTRDECRRLLVEAELSVKSEMVHLMRVEGVQDEDVMRNRLVAYMQAALPWLRTAILADRAKNTREATDGN